MRWLDTAKDTTNDITNDITKDTTQNITKDIREDIRADTTEDNTKDDTQNIPQDTTDNVTEEDTTAPNTNHQTLTQPPSSSTRLLESIPDEGLGQKMAEDVLSLPPPTLLHSFDAKLTSEASSPLLYDIAMSHSGRHVIVTDCWNRCLKAFDLTLPGSPCTSVYQLKECPLCVATLSQPERVVVTLHQEPQLLVLSVHEKDASLKNSDDVAKVEEKEEEEEEDIQIVKHTQESDCNNQERREVQVTIDTDKADKSEGEKGGMGIQENNDVEKVEEKSEGAKRIVDNQDMHDSADTEDKNRSDSGVNAQVRDRNRSDSGPKSQILSFHSVITTSCNYRGISTLGPATSGDIPDERLLLTVPKEIHVVSLQGDLLRVIAPSLGGLPLLEDVIYITTTPSNHLLVSDMGARRVLCLTLSGHLQWLHPSPHAAEEERVEEEEEEEEREEERKEEKKEEKKGEKGEEEREEEEKGEEWGKEEREEGKGKKMKEEEEGREGGKKKGKEEEEEEEGKERKGKERKEEEEEGKERKGKERKEEEEEGKEGKKKGKERKRKEEEEDGKQEKEKEEQQEQQGGSDASSTPKNLDQTSSTHPFTGVQWPMGLAADIQGRVFVCDLEQHGVVLLSPQGVAGRLLLTDSHTLQFPRGLSISQDCLCLTQDHCVKVFSIVS
ncbi:hypothetical protein ACOMHN_020545 [Nucella lapillus]